MSDRVAYFVGNTAGRDHIQWPTVTPAQLATLGFVRWAGCNLDSIMACAWRVRKWRIEAGVATLSGHYTIFDGILHTVVLSSTFPIPAHDVTMTGTRESFQVGFAVQNTLRSSGFSGAVNQNVNETRIVVVDSDPPVTTTESRLLHVNSLMFGTGDDTELVSYDSGPQLFSPYFGSFGTLGPVGQISFGPDPVGNGGTITVDPVVAPSFTAPIKFNLTNGEGDSGTVDSAGLDLIMTAVEFWPYKNSAGDPVYDSGTGAQINDPFS